MGLLALLMAVAVAPSDVRGADWEGKKLILSVHPYLASTEIVRRFTPLAHYLSKKLNRPVKLRVSRDYQEHIEYIGKGGAVVAYMGPVSYVKADRLFKSRVGGLRALAIIEVNGKGSFKGAIVKRAGSGLRTIADLEGKRFAFGDPSSTMSHLVPRYMLLEVGVNIGESEHLSSHNNVALGVLSGRFDAGAVMEDVYEKYKDRGLALLTYTPTISEHVFVAGRSMSKHEADAIANALMVLPLQEGGPRILESIKKGLTSLRRPAEHDYDNLRDIMDVLEKAGVGQ